MKGHHLIAVAVAGLLLLPAASLLAQPVSRIPERAPGVDAIVERQVERQRERAARAAEQLSQQAERAQRQAERVAQQAERAQQGAAENVQQQVAERVQQQTGRAQQQVERVQRQAQRAQQQVERAQQQAERAQQQAEQVQQKVERVQLQAERAQQQAERLQQQVEQVGRLVPAVADRAREQAEDRSGGQPEVRQGRPAEDRNPRRGSQQEQIPQPAIVQAQNPQPQAETDPAPPAETDPPEPLAIADQADEPPFVEIMIEPNVRVLEREWLMMVTAPQRDELAVVSPQLMAYHVETRPFEALDSFLLKFRVPPGLDSEELLGGLVPESLRTLLDRNHVYSLQSDSRMADKHSTAELAVPMASVCTRDVSVGMIDTAVDSAHAAFNQAGRAVPVISRDFLQEEMDRPIAHGTAVAGILAGTGPGLNPLLPNATVYSASVMYSQDPDHQGASAMHLLEALDWLIGQDVAVINMSLTGPANRLLEQGINAAIARGKVIVAATGNEGPHAAALYPAAYENVVTATAVARDGSIYRWANQGEYVDFAALGVEVPTAIARGEGDFGVESGTSMAAPVVSAFLACALTETPDREQVLSRLAALALDLGKPGHDPVYGHGLLHPQAF